MTTATTKTMRTMAMAAAMFAAACGTPATVKELQVSPPAPTVANGLSTQLAAVAIYSDNTRVDVTNEVAWTTTDAAVAPVTSTGRVTGATRGAALVRASWKGFRAEASLAVTEEVPVALELRTADASMPRGVTVEVQAIATMSNGAELDVTDQVAWVAGNESVALATPGVVRGAEIGQATVQASLAGLSAAMDFEVRPATPVSIAITGADAATPAGLQAQVVARATFTDGTVVDVTRSASWTSAVPAVATVAAGTVAAVAEGTTELVAAFGPVSTSAAFAVSPARLVSIAVSPATLALAWGDSAKLTALGTYTDGRQLDVTSLVTFASSSAAVAAVSNALASLGAVSTLGAGAAVVTATEPASGLTATADVTVSAPVLVRLVVSATSANLKAGDSLQLSVTGTWSNGASGDVTATLGWASLSPGTATVSASGLVTGVAASNRSATIVGCDPQNPLLCVLSSIRVH